MLNNINDLIKTLETFHNNGVEMKIDIADIIGMLKLIAQNDFNKAITFINEKK